MLIRTMLILLVLLSALPLCAAERPKRIKSDTTAVVTQTAPVVVPVTVLSIIPAQAEPGGKVTLAGSGFGESASVFLGSVEVPAKITDGRVAEILLPAQLEAGLYAMYLKRSDGVLGRTYNFSVLPVRPQLSSLQPPRISSCATGKDREVVARGANFGESSLLFFDGAALPATLQASDSLTFTVPSMAVGLHQVQVRNAADNSSAALALTIETKPEINQVSIGTEHVNYYELIVTGRNFSQNSSLYVDGYQIGGRGGQDMTEREKLIYMDCSTLIYQRHPYSPANKDFRVQVVNPGGEGSQVVTVTAP